MKRIEIFQHLLLLHFWIYYHVTWGISLHYCLLINLHLQSRFITGRVIFTMRMIKYANIWTLRGVHVCGMSSNMFGIDRIDVRIYTQIETLYQYFWDQPGPTVHKREKKDSKYIIPFVSNVWEPMRAEFSICWKQNVYTQSQITTVCTAGLYFTGGMVERGRYIIITPRGVGQR